MRGGAAPPPASRARLTMAMGRTIDVTLFTDEAPETTARFIRLARQGYYNGLSFWRVAPGFVLQGGSPGSNEYSGDGPFMRDELGLRSNARGTIGLSTPRGHTGMRSSMQPAGQSASTDFTVWRDHGWNGIADAVSKRITASRCSRIVTPTPETNR